MPPVRPLVAITGLSTIHQGIYIARCITRLRPAAAESRSIKLRSSSGRFYGRNAAPEVLESVQRYGHRVKIFVGDISPPQHRGMTLMHALQPIAHFGPLLGDPDIHPCALLMSQMASPSNSSWTVARKCR